MTPSRRDAVQFTRESAERIAGVVRTIEVTPRPGAPFAYDPLLQSVSSRKVFRVGTFTGAWPIGTFSTVTLASGATLSAINRFIDHPAYGTRNCAVAKDGTAWHLVQWQWDASTALSSATLGTASLQFSRINVPSLGTAITVSVSVTTCSP